MYLMKISLKKYLFVGLLCTGTLPLFGAEQKQGDATEKKEDNKITVKENEKKDENGGDKPNPNLNDSTKEKKENEGGETNPTLNDSTSSAAAEEVEEEGEDGETNSTFLNESKIIVEKQQKGAGNKSNSTLNENEKKVDKTKTEPKIEITVNNVKVEITAENLRDKLRETAVAEALDAYSMKNGLKGITSIIKEYQESHKSPEARQELLNDAVGNKCLAIVIKALESKIKIDSKLKIDSKFLIDNYKDLVNFANDVYDTDLVDRVKLEILEHFKEIVVMTVQYKDEKTGEIKDENKALDSYKTELFRAHPDLFFLNGINKEYAAATAAQLAGDSKNDVAFRGLNRDECDELVDMMNEKNAVTFSKAITHIKAVWKDAHPRDYLITGYSYLAPMMTYAACFATGYLFKNKQENKMKKWLAVGAFGTFALCNTLITKGIVGKRAGNFWGSLLKNTFVGAAGYCTKGIFSGTKKVKPYFGGTPSKKTVNKEL